MIVETLRALRSGGQTPEDIASRLNIEPGELRRRFDLLEKSGYIARLKEVPCAGTCPGCRGSRSRCPSKERIATYALTEKGTRAMDRAGR